MGRVRLPAGRTYGKGAFPQAQLPRGARKLEEREQRRRLAPTSLGRKKRERRETTRMQSSLHEGTLDGRIRI